MNHVIIGLSVIALATIACNNGSNTNVDNKKTDSTQVATTATKESTTSGEVEISINKPMKEMVTQYLQIKNALANDNSKAAADAGNAFAVSMGKTDRTSLSAEKKKTWDDLSDDAKEMAEHIGKSADKIEHQREHFDMLSKDVYDMVKTFGAGQTLYKDFCPMYKEKEGATWLSETKEIKNPYLGKKMPDCGLVKEEIK